MSARHLLAISLRPSRRPRGYSLGDARAVSPISREMRQTAGSLVAVRLWWRGRPIVLVSNVEAMGGSERDGGGGMDPSSTKIAFRPGP